MAALMAAVGALLPGTPHRPRLTGRFVASLGEPGTRAPAEGWSAPGVVSIVLSR